MPRRRPSLAKLRPLELLEPRCNPSTLVDPLQLSSVNGVLDITLTAHNSSQVIEVAGSDPSKPGVPTLVDGFMTFAWTVHQGVASNGQTSGDGYPSPTLHVNPGDTLRIHLENQLVGWSGQPEDTNIHTHGLDFSPIGNSDNVLLSIPNGQTNDYSYQIPTNQDGAFWYHPHMHGDVAEQVYRGLAGLLIVGNANSDIDQVQNLPTRLMDVQVQRIETSPTTGRPTLVPLQFGNYDHTQWTINGQYLPDIAMTNPYEVWVTMALDPRDLTRTFIPQSNDQSTWDFNSLTNQHVYYIAQDGSAFPQTVLKGRAAIAPGKRIAEVVASPAPGTDKYFALTAISPIFANPMPQMTQPLARIIPAATAGNPDAWNNVALTNPVHTFEDLSQLPVDQYRTVYFRTDRTDPKNPKFLINDQMFPNAPVF